MSAIGTGIAAAVAQTGLQSQQVARQKDKRENSRTREAQRDTEVFQTRLLGLEEHDGDEAATRLHIDNEQSDREHPDDQRAERHAQAEQQSEGLAAAQPERLPDAQTLLSRLDATADPAVKRNATRKPDASPGSASNASGDDPSALYTHIDIKA